MRVGEYLAACLKSFGVRHIFGIPGVHTGEIYRGLTASGLRHITPRHEQGAGFMADGYARVGGEPGVCLTITGPGLTNIITAAAQARQDSVPMLVISSVNARDRLGHHSGALHELPDQRRVAESVFASSHTILRTDDIGDVLSRIFASFAAARPQPSHLEIPLDLMAEEARPRKIPPPLSIFPPMASDDAIAQAAEILQKSKRPLLLLGGGARKAAGEMRRLAEKLDAPAVMTINARGLIPSAHPLAIPASPSLLAVKNLMRKADAVLAVGTELGQTDYDLFDRGPAEFSGRLIRLDIDALQTVRNAAPDLAMVGDAAATASGLLKRLRRRQSKEGAKRARIVRKNAWRELSTTDKKRILFLDDIRRALPKAVIAGDSTQTIYAGNLYFAADGGWFNAATGYGTLGYAPAAAIGAQLAAPQRPVVCVVGDGGFQFSLGEIGTAMDAVAPVIFIVINNNGYGEIRKQFSDIGAEMPKEPAPPNFTAVADAYGIDSVRLWRRENLESELQSAYRKRRALLIEVDERLVTE